MNRTDDWFNSEAASEQCLALAAALRLGPMGGAVGLTATGFLVMIYESQKRPALIKWHGRPVEYRIGGGMPRALAS